MVSPGCAMRPPGRESHPVASSTAGQSIAVLVKEKKKKKKKNILKKIFF